MTFLVPAVFRRPAVNPRESCQGTPCPTRGPTESSEQRHGRCMFKKLRSIVAQTPWHRCHAQVWSANPAGRDLTGADPRFLNTFDAANCSKDSVQAADRRFLNGGSSRSCSRISVHPANTDFQMPAWVSGLAREGGPGPDSCRCGIDPRNLNAPGTARCSKNVAQSADRRFLNHSALPGCSRTSVHRTTWGSRRPF